uniref:Uncharacterized protein n=1 Tax=Melanopsichium pennsylvanicum 4 TaxID=1398559 RepID=A0A077RCJ5_9BASI|nr:putative protein [Melanopsichium pennsylvanicum 4]
MMSELSLGDISLNTSTTPTSTPVAAKSKPRRISILPISHADLSSPTAARHQLQLLELENVGLSEELAHSEEENARLKAQVEALRSQSVSCTASTCSSASASSASSSSAYMITEAIPSSSSIESLGDMDITKKYLAQMKAASRLINRLTTHMSSHNPSTIPSAIHPSESLDESAYFNLDQSLVFDPERSVVAPSSTHLTTPNGKTKVERQFESDLLDDIGSLGAVWEEYARKASFASVEQSFSLQNAMAQNEILSAQIQELRTELEKAHTSTMSLEEKDAVIDQLKVDLVAAEQTQTELKAHADESKARLSDVQENLTQTAAKLDQITAEQELTIQAAARKSNALIEALQEELADRNAELDALQATSTATPAADAELSASLVTIRELEQQLENAKTKLEELRMERDEATAHLIKVQSEVGTLSANTSQSERIAELESQLATTTAQIEELQDAQQTAADESFAQVLKIQAELERLRANSPASATSTTDSAERVSELEKQLRTTASQLEELRAEQEVAAQKSSAKIVELQAQLDQRRSASSSVQSILTELSEKKDRLHAIKLRNTQIASLQRVSALQERVVDLLERAPAGNELLSYLGELSASLAQLRCSRTVANSATVVERGDASTSTVMPTRIDASTTADMPIEQDVKPLPCHTEDHKKLVDMLKGEIEELQARILRRNEQIGSLQKQLSQVRNDLDRTRTNQALAEGITLELDEEKLVHLALIKELKGKVDSLTSGKNNKSEAGTQTADGENSIKKKVELEVALETAQKSAARLTEQLAEATESKTRIGVEQSALKGKVEELQHQVSDLSAQVQVVKAVQVENAVQTTENHSDLVSALTDAREQIFSLEAQLETMRMHNDTLSTGKTTLETEISCLAQELIQLRTALSDSQKAAEVVEAQEGELKQLRSQLRKSEDRLSLTQLELDALNVTLAEQRESASADADRIEVLELQLSALQTEHEALCASSARGQATVEESRGQICELTTKLAGLENEALESSSALSLMEVDRNAALQHKTDLEDQLAELTAKHVELEQVLAERDAAIQIRNKEYWDLKEELAELQEAAERSNSDMPTLETVSALQAELESSKSERDALSERIGAQESALLKLKADLSSARSTEEMLNDQYAAAQRRAKDLETLVSELESQPVADTATCIDPELKAKLEKAEVEVSYLNTRIEELEEELGRKAEEIEEADSKILDALKESKKYATRYTKLTGKYETLQAELKMAQFKLDGLQYELDRLKTAKALTNTLGASIGTSKVREGREGEGGAVIGNGSGDILAGRKRSKPDSVDEEPTRMGITLKEVAKSTTNTATPKLSRTDLGVGVKVVYAPSPSSHKRTPSGSDFTPVRRSAVLLKNVIRSHKKPSADDHHNHHPTQQSIVLGLGTPVLTTTPPELAAAGKVGVVQDQDQGGMFKTFE